MRKIIIRFICRLVIFSIHKWFKDGLTPIFSTGENRSEIIAWRWMWTTALEKELASKL